MEVLKECMVHRPGVNLKQLDYILTLVSNADTSSSVDTDLSTPPRVSHIAIKAMVPQKVKHSLRRLICQKILRAVPPSGVRDHDQQNVLAVEAQIRAHDPRMNRLYKTLAYRFIKVVKHRLWTVSDFYARASVDKVY